MKRLILLNGFLLTVMTAVMAQPCADAGKDTLICGLSYSLIGNPSGGSWTAICHQADSILIIIDSISPGNSTVKVNKCGKVEFVYTIHSGICPSNDTVAVSFENRSYTIETLNHEIEIIYPSANCYSNPIDSCGQTRSIGGLDPPSPLWKFNFQGVCELVKLKLDITGADYSNCSADSFQVSIQTHMDTTQLVWSTRQNAFLSFDQNQQISDNRLDAYISQIQQNVLNDLKAKCPLNKCFVETSTCGDTLESDTLKYVVPIHRGGHWVLLDNGTEVELNKLSVLRIGSKNYALRFSRSPDYYGPNSQEIQLTELDDNFAEVKFSQKVNIEIQWKEFWTYDTLEFIFPKEISDQSCSCFGRNLLFEALPEVKVPEYNCPAIRLSFTPDIQIQFTGDHGFCKEEFAEIGIESTFETYSWSNASDEKSIAVFREGYYSVMVTDSFHCSDTAGIFIRQFPLPEFEVKADERILCRGMCTVLRAIGDTNNIVIWNLIDTSRSIEICPDRTLHHLAQMIDSNGCKSDKSIEVVVAETPDPNAGQDLQLTCSIHFVNLEPFRLDTIIGRKFFWTGPDILPSNSRLAQPTVALPGIYILSVVDTFSGCTGRDTVEVFDNTLPPYVYAGEDQILSCGHSQIELKGDSSHYGLGYLTEWFGPDVNSSNKNMINISVGLPGQYILKIINLTNDCTASDTVIVNSDKELPLADAGIDKLIACDSVGTTIGGNNGSFGPDITYMWSGPDINAGNMSQRFPFVRVPGNYTLILTNIMNFCQDTDIVVVANVSVFPMAKAIKSSDLGCGVDSTFLSANSSTGNNLQIIWTGPDITSANSFQKLISIKKEGQYILTVRDSITHCLSHDTILIHSNGQFPDAQAGPNVQINCQRDFAILESSINEADSSIIIKWSGPDINNSNNSARKPIVTLPGTYILNVKFKNSSCEIYDTVQVSENLIKPIIDLPDTIKLNCKNRLSNILPQISNISSEFRFRWLGPQTDTISTENIALITNKSGVFVYSVLPPNTNCNSSDSVYIEVDTTLYGIGLAQTLMLPCSDKQLIFIANHSEKLDSIVWYNTKGVRLYGNKEGKEFTFRNAGNFTYVSHQSNGCVTYGVVEVILISQLEFKKEIVSSCPNQINGSLTVSDLNGASPYSVTLDNKVQPIGRTYFTNLSPGQHIIKIVDANQCLIIDTFFIHAYPGLDFKFLTTDTSYLCGEETIELDAYYGDTLIYNWIGENVKTPQLVVNRFGIFTVEYKDLHQCESVRRSFAVLPDTRELEKSIKIPNVFIPTGEDINKTFKPYFENPESISNYDMSIFDRWGNLVYFTYDPTHSWDGTKNSEAMPMDTYIAVISGKIDLCGEKSEFKFTKAVQLIR